MTSGDAPAAMSVLCLPRYAELGASSRVRFRQYYPSLRRSLRLAEDALLSDEYLRRKYRHRGIAMAAVRDYLARLGRLVVPRRRFDAYWLEKELFPWIPAGLEFLLLRRPYVLDLDDAIFHSYDLHPNVLLRALFSRKIDRLMRRAALVTAGNAYLAERARSAGARRIEVLPTVVDLDRYPMRDREPPADVLRVGWIGSPATARYLAMLAEPLRRAARQCPLRLVVIGADVALPGLEVECIPWSAATEAEAIAGCHIGVMPLPDSPWERGKCGYKLIQYMACGLPVVASSVGVNTTLVREGENGFLAADDAGWCAALARLGGDPPLRRRLGAAGRKLVEAEYCLQVTAPRLARWLQVVATGH